jgi:nickel-dependent lactate racemase
MLPESDILRLDGNPVFDQIAGVAAAMRAGNKQICAINEIIRGGVLVAAAAGDPIATVKELLPTVRSIFCHEISEPADVIRLNVPWPLGRNFYQADKALKNNHRAVRDGGGIILEADCPEGIGPDAFMELLARADDYASSVRWVEEKGYRLGDHKAVKLRHLTDPKCRGVRVAIVSDHVTESQAATAGMKVFTDAQAALQWLAASVRGLMNRGLIIEDAGHLAVTAGAPR